MKKGLAFVAAVMIVLSSLWLVRSRHQSRRAQEVRDALYQEQLSRFQRNVQLGMHRVDVKSYLDSAKVSYLQMNSNLDVKIGEDPAAEWYCDRWYVYIEFRFSHVGGQVEPVPLDNLDSISIQKIGSCL
jgi:hypothetical protein